jgi:peroxiredoxin
MVSSGVSTSLGQSATKIAPPNALPLERSRIGKLVNNHSFQAADGTATELRSLRGKTIAVAFILTTCPHCQQTCATLEKLYGEWKTRQFLPLALAFNPMAVMLTEEFKQKHKLSFPVFFGERADVDAVMGFSPDRRILVPQLAVVDRKGILRYQTPEESSVEISTEAGMRSKISRWI